MIWLILIKSVKDISAEIKLFTSLFQEGLKLGFMLTELLLTHSTGQ